MSNKLTPMAIEVTPVNEHIMRLRIHRSLGGISLVSAYTPTEVSDLTEMEAFYAMLESVVDRCPRCQLKARCCGICEEALVNVYK